MNNSDDQKLASALNAVIMAASNKMVVLEKFEGKSEDFRRGFISGVNHQTQYTIINMAKPLKEYVDALGRVLGVGGKKRG